MEPFTRLPAIKITIDQWDWKKGNMKGLPLDVTQSVLSYQFLKSIKNPSGSCQISMLPQREAVHILDYLSPMDVVKIYEFDTLKFIGFIRKIAYAGTIGQDGKPTRSGTLIVSDIGALLYEVKTGLGIGTAIGRPDDELYKYSKILFVAISDTVQEGETHKKIIETVVNSLKDYISALGGTAFLNYISSYFIVGKGLQDSLSSNVPKDFQLYTGNEESLGFWDILGRLIEKPFNECFVDNGPRKISLNGKDVSLNEEKTYLIFRSAPFDGWVNAWSNKAFQDLEAVNIDADHLTKFNLSASMDEMYTSYTVKHAAHQFSEIPRMLLGQYSVDKPQLGKYLYRPLIVEQLYTRQEKTDATDIDVATSEIDTSSKDLADTLLNWYTHNDEYLSGSISFHIPSDGTKDVRIGDKVTVYGIEGAFYVEGISHTWQYRGPVLCDLSVTRGFNINKKIELSNKIFKRNVIK